ncbi:hypothetical protein [Micromonospora sp. 15K316]|uniref:hypothetical protein n=1 Tax=Micromonospora sp. 15K316 TaxID=2530376 RepID=UPI00140538AE|nr:hypothetical protein [Micromonospora sp. 15K316]
MAANQSGSEAEDGIILELLSPPATTSNDAEPRQIHVSDLDAARWSDDAMP